MKIGAMVESFRLGFRESVEKAASLGIEGIQAYATDGDINPATITNDQKKEFIDIVKSNGLVFSALCGDWGYGFDDPDRNADFIERSKRALDLSNEFGCGIVTTHVAHIDLEECPRKEIMRKACRELAEYADSVGAAFAIETGIDHGKDLAEFLDSLGANGVRVNFDPANLVMCIDERPEESLKYLGKYVAHTHAKDGYMISKRLERELASADLASGEATKNHQALIDMGHLYMEVPLGEGDVDFDIYLPALAATGYDSFLTIEREVGANPVADIELAVNFLREKINKFGLKN